MTNKINLYENKVMFNLPKEFVLDSEAEKYFISTKPEYVFIDNETKALVSVLKTEYEITDIKIEDRITDYFELHRRSVANFANFNMAKKKTKSGVDIAALYYTSTSQTRNLYNFFVLTYLDNHELIFTLHCNIEDIPKFGIKFMNVVNSIDILA